MEVSQSTLQCLHPSSTSKRKSKQVHKATSATKQPSYSSTISQSLPSSKAISISSSSPSPVTAFPRIPGDIINISDSNSSDMYCKPVKHRKAMTPHNYSGMTVVKQEQCSSMPTPTTIPPEEKQWPSNYPILDIIHVLHSCKPPPKGTTVAQHFYSLTGVPFKSSTYYDAWSK